ncbi:hypothetical protein F1880_009996 [Penicillium rolfsii]|nr:hypothetical protein F1880_009996 [Penicillium rolfsii]
MTVGAIIWGFLYAYNIDVANNIAGGLEDKINKPDRPIASREMSLIGAKVRYVLSTTVFLGYSYVLKVHT